MWSKTDAMEFLTDVSEVLIHRPRNSIAKAIRLRLAQMVRLLGAQSLEQSLPLLHEFNYMLLLLKHSPLLEARWKERKGMLLSIAARSQVAATGKALTQKLFMTLHAQAKALPRSVVIKQLLEAIEEISDFPERSDRQYYRWIEDIRF